MSPDEAIEDLHKRFLGAFHLGRMQGKADLLRPSAEMVAAGNRVMQHGLATPADIWDAMYRAAMGEPLENIEPKVKP